MNTPTTHCQICARAIKVKNGSIALHGYKRPRLGWQTASCIGARYRPYEVACDRIPYAIELAERFKAQREAFLHELTTNPPTTLRVLIGHGSFRQKQVAIRERPEGFDPANPQLDYRPNSYTTEWSSLVFAAKRDIAEVGPEIEALRKRLADWKAPEAA